MSGPASPRVHTAALSELAPATLYALLRLRLDIFVVEQASAYPELDGRDLEPGARHWWVEDGTGPVSYLRVLGEPDGSRRISRVVTRADRRGRGHAALLIRRALDSGGGTPVRVSAQAHLADWYAGFGFRVVGPGYDEDGIPHVPMERL